MWTLSQLPCPRCSYALYGTTCQGCSLFACSSCGGLWLDNTAAERIQAGMSDSIQSVANLVDGGAKQPPNDLSAKLYCPNCRSPMRRSIVGPVELDVCTTHGTWFDKSELVQVALFFREQIQKKRRPAGLPPAVAATAVAAGATVVAGAAIAGAATSMSGGDDNDGDSGIDAEDVVDGAEVAMDVAEGTVEILGGIFDLLS